MEVVARCVDCFTDVVVCFKMGFPYSLLFPREESTLGFGSSGELGRGL